MTKRNYETIKVIKIKTRNNIECNVNSELYKKQEVFSKFFYDKIH